MSTSISSPPAASNSTVQANRRTRRWVTLIATVALIFVVFLVVRLQGLVTGSEFAPSHFQQRSFRFYELPLLHLQITPIQRVGITPKAATFVRQKSLIVPHSGAPAAWHLVEISRGLSGSTRADAQLLIEQLNLDSGGDAYWRKWSIDHPQHAKVLWPVVQKLAVRELYVLMPALFELAQLEQSPDKLQEEIDRHLSQQYLRLVQDMEAAERDDLAGQLLLEAKQDYPLDRDLAAFRLRSEQSPPAPTP